MASRGYPDPFGLQQFHNPWIGALTGQQQLTTHDQLFAQQMAAQQNMNANRLGLMDGMAQLTKFADDEVEIIDSLKAKTYPMWDALWKGAGILAYAASVWFYARLTL